MDDTPPNQPRGRPVPLDDPAEQGTPNPAGDRDDPTVMKSPTAPRSRIRTDDEAGDAPVGTGRSDR